MKSTRSWTKSLLALSLVILLGVGIIGLGVCTSEDETDEPTIGDVSGQSVLSEDDEPTAPTIYTEFPFDADEALRRQEEAAEVLDIPVEFENSIGMNLRLIPAGEFMMGSPEEEELREENENLHRVRLTKPIYMDACEVTQGEWEEVMETTPWKGDMFVREGANNPATYVSWEDAKTFCEWLSEIEGRIYRLPTEAEWEYACRAGSTTAFYFGDSNSRLDEYAWYDENARDSGHRHPGTVGKKQANAWGLHDMHGNESVTDSPTQSPANSPT